MTFPDLTSCPAIRLFFSLSPYPSTHVFPLPTSHYFFPLILLPTPHPPPPIPSYDFMLYLFIHLVYFLLIQLFSNLLLFPYLSPIRSFLTHSYPFPK